MNLFLESAMTVASLGLLAIGMAAIVYFQTRSRGSVLAIGGLILLTIGALAIEQGWQTPTEQVTSATNSLLDAIESNDLASVLRLIDISAANMRSDAEVLMPQFDVENAGAGGLKIEFDNPSDPTTATVNTKALIKARHLKSGITGGYFDGLQLDFIKRDDKWRVSGYRPAKDWRKETGKLNR